MNQDITHIIAEQAPSIILWLQYVVSLQLFLTGVRYFRKDFKKAPPVRMFHLLVMESCFFVTLVLLVAGVKHLYIAFSLESFIEFLLYTHLCLISVDSYEKYACPIEGMDF